MWLAIIASATITIAFAFRIRRYYLQRQRMTKSEIVEILERRLHGGVGQSREWARFVDVPFKDAEIEAIRQRSVDFDLVLTDEKRLALQELIREIRDQVPRGRQ